MPAPRVFVSYSHDSEPHRQRVLELAGRLRGDGVDAWIDRYALPPPEGWLLWMEREIERAHWIIVVCTETYRRRFDGKEARGVGRGVSWEGNLIRSRIYEVHAQDSKLIPILFDASDEAYVPAPLRGIPRYLASADYAGLLRHIRNLPEVAAPRVELSEQTTHQPLGVMQIRSEGLRSSPIPDINPPPRRKRTPPRRLLIVAANPDTTDRLALDQEIRGIILALRNVRTTPEILWAATAQDLKAAMLEIEPQILHFCAHGSPSGIYLENEPGSDGETDAASLAQWIRIAIAGQQRPADLIILNFCRSEIVLNILAGCARVVLGPIQDLGDLAAIHFSSMFYASLAAGQSDIFSYHFARASIAMNSIPSGAYAALCPDLDLDARPSAPVDRRRVLHKLVFFASNPSSTDRLRLDREMRGITTALSRTIRSGTVSVAQRWAVRPSDFLQALLELRPSIVHITGSGGHDGFIFESDDGQVCVSDHQALADALTLFRDDIRCVILMFCESHVLAERLADVLDYTVAIVGNSDDNLCQMFAAAFYQMINADRSIQDAFKAGCSAVAVLSRREEFGQFKLYGREASDPRSA